MASLRPIFRAITASAPQAQWRGFTQTARPRLIRPAARAFSISVTRFSKPYEFDAVQSLSSNSPPDTILIDVREPSEYAEGHIPGAINIPVKSQPEALMLAEDEFEDRFGFEKPQPDVHTVFYCRAGVRSRAAAQIAERAGYKDVGDYSGSWLDWTANGGKVAR
ncbi:Rhodanese-like protein [Myriangium duriaei CBS 260.36]|uniref:Rhodanese-like protein n=1 Tax=Myriangium duriaei CBS 260.36 TaxID=1168546 RepID=A0A9P4J2J8_9PEZI|nr:Rhodanese-like protein [Myriangium duriaei CBS 260.36]